MQERSLKRFKKIFIGGKTSESDMSINTPSEISANLQIGPTDEGMVRIYVEADGVEIPMDFNAEEATEIAEEIMAAAQMVATK